MRLLEPIMPFIGDLQWMFLELGIEQSWYRTILDTPLMSDITDVRLAANDDDLEEEEEAADARAEQHPPASSGAASLGSADALYIPVCHF